MIRLSKLITLLLASITPMVVSCTSIPPLPVPPDPPKNLTSLDDRITPDNTHAVIEIAQLSWEKAGPVAALMFTPDTETLLAVYAREGVLRRWRLADQSLSQTLDVHPIEFGAIAFDADGRLLATGAGVEWEQYKKEDEYLGLRVWNTESGELVLRAAEKYDVRTDLLTRSLAPDVALEPNGAWVLVVDASASKDLEGFKDVHMYEVTTGHIGGLLVDFSRRREEDDFDVIAFDALGEFYAAADQAGKVAIYRFDPPHHPAREQAVLERAKDSFGPIPLALAFDPTRHWLARIRGTELVVWDLQSLSYPRQIDTQVSIALGPTASLAFDPSGKLLGVGTIDGWQIWNVQGKQLLMRGDGEGVYAVAFSLDGRWFAWGDGAGIVHLWGLRES